MITETKTIWEFLEEEHPKAKETNALFQWSLNYDYDKRPFNLFLDLIGWSALHYGSPIFDMTTVHMTVGYMEADYLGDALKEWADDPHSVESWIETLMGLED